MRNQLFFVAFIKKLARIFAYILYCGVRLPLTEKSEN